MDYTIEQYLKFEFFDSVGPVNIPGIGTILYLSNQEVSAPVVNTDEAELRTFKTQSGNAVASTVYNPESWDINIRLENEDSAYKIRHLILNFQQGFRCRFSILSGNRFKDLTTDSFPNVVQTMDVVAEFSPTDFRKIQAGYGLKWREVFSFRVYRTVNLTVPTNANTSATNLQSINTTIQGGQIQYIRVN